MPSREHKNRTNGVQQGEINAERFAQWQSTVEDYKPYIHQGMLSKSRVAREAGLNRDVFATNPEIRDRLWPDLIRRLEDQGVLRPRVANPREVIPRPERKSAAEQARIKQIQEQNEALKAENLELRRQLERLGVMEEVLASTGRLPW